MSDKTVPVGQDGKRHFFMTLHNKLQQEKIVYTVSEKPQNEKANENWVVTIGVKGVDYTGGPMTAKKAAKEVAAEKALRALGWL
ncbi:hypothetical protein FS837_007944 [Tulasnella sp. UAMH 9824]|nr:hypothetical protein FS837_007944 [Tulasnella sp. UAMH 9824]